MKKLLRKSFLTSVVLVLVISLSGLSYAQQSVELRLAHFMPTQHVQHREVMDPWSQEISKLTEGRLQVTIFPGGVLGKPPDQYDNAANGIVDIAFVIPSYTPGKFPLTSVMELPFLISDAEQASEALWEIYEEYLTAEFKDVKVLWMFVHGPGHIHTTKKPIKTLEDMKGLKIRSPGPIMAKVLKAFGAVPVGMPITEVYTALERGTIDGVAIPWEAMRAFRFYELCDYHTELDLYTVPFLVAMNARQWESLPEDLQEVIAEHSGKVMSMQAGKAYANEDIPGKEACLANNGTIYQLPAEEKERWISAVANVRAGWLDDMKAKGLPGEEILSTLEEKLND